MDAGDWNVPGVQRFDRVDVGAAQGRALGLFAGEQIQCSRGVGAAERPDGRDGKGEIAHARNLNGHPAYKKFRAVRARLRDGGQDLNGDRLARTLAAYSERGPAYVRPIRAIIRVNELHQYDKARLGDRVTPRPSNPDA